MRLTPTPPPCCARWSPSPASRGRKAYKSVLATPPAPEFCKTATNTLPPEQTKREAERRKAHLPAAPHSRMLLSESACGRGAGFAKPARLPALHRGACFGELTPQLSSSRASWVRRHRVSPASSPIPVQRAPRRPVIVTGRAVSGAARERVYGPPAGTALAPHPRVPSRRRLSAT